MERRNTPGVRPFIVYLKDPCQALITSHHILILLTPQQFSSYDLQVFASVSVQGQVSIDAGGTRSLELFER